MIHRIALTAAALCALSACNSGPTVSEKNAKPSEVAGAVAAAGGGAFLSPGLWESTTKMDMSGMAMPNLAIISIHPPGPCRVSTTGSTVTFTPIQIPPGPPA